MWPVATTRDAFFLFQSLYQERSLRFFDVGGLTAGSVSGWAPQIMMQAVRDIRDEVELLDKDLIGTKLTKVQYVLNQREYAVPSNFLEAIKVEITDLGGPPYPTLSPIDFEEVGAVIGTAGFLPGITGASIGEPR